MYPVNGQAAAPAVRVSPGSDAVRHPWEIPLLVLAVLTTVVTYVVAIVLIAAGDLSTWILVVLAAPILLFLARGQLYGSQQVNGIKMTPSQFPEGYQLVAEAAARFGMKTPPDAYVVLGNGRINAFASGHGFRRFVVVYSDLFEVGGQAREPDALAFIIGPRGRPHRCRACVVLAPVGTVRVELHSGDRVFAVAFHGVHGGQLRLSHAPSGCTGRDGRPRRGKVSGGSGRVRRTGRSGDTRIRVLPVGSSTSCRRIRC